MSAVNPPDGGYQYYQRKISDLEDDLKREGKRARERYDERSDSLEKSYRQSLDRHDRELASSVNDIRENASAAHAHEQANHKAEVERLKAATYDRFGRYGGEESDVLKQQLAEVRAASEQQQQKYRQSQNESEASYNQRLADMNQLYQNQTEHTVASVRDEADAELTQLTEEQKRLFTTARDGAIEKYNRLNREHLDESNSLRSQSQRGADEVKRDYTHQRDEARRSEESRSDLAAKAAVARAEEAARINRDGRNEDTRGLRDTVRDLVSHEGEYMHEKGKGTEDAVREHDAEFRDRQQLMDASYQREIHKLKNDASNADHYFARLNNDSLHAKDRYFAGIIGHEQLENQKSTEDLRTQLLKDHKQLEARNARDLDQSQKALERLAIQGAEQKTAALESQSKSFEESFDRQNKNDQSQIRLLEGKLQQARTSDDISLVSPSAEAHIRNALTAQYEKKFQAEFERDARSTDSMQKEYAHRMEDLNQQKATESRLMTQKHTAENHATESMFLSHEANEDNRKESLINEAATEHQRMTDNLIRNYANMLEHQRQEYEEKMSAQQNDSANKIQTVRQEGEFNTKMAMSAFTAQQNDLIREYERKLTDQKVSYESQLEETKSRAGQLTRETEKKSRIDLEQQSRSYEQKIAQMEFQEKERERLITQNFQDELEKVKRSNALLIQKKS